MCPAWTVPKTVLLRSSLQLNWRAHLQVTLREDTLPTATVTAVTEVCTLTLDRASFRRLLGSHSVQGALEGNMKSYVFKPTPTSADKKTPIKTHSFKERAAQMASALTNSMKDILRSPSRKEMFHNLQRKDLVFLQELGLGMSGVAYLCKVLSNNKFIVVKMMSKAKLIRLNQVENVMREKEILMHFDNTFIIKCMGHFQDSTHLYLLMEYMAGGELFSLLNQKQRFSLPLSVFYAAEVLICLEYIHSNGYVYRDLKPENILINEYGHVRLADMGFCKPLAEGQKTYTTCGTADYMAPEVMLSQGHDKAADFWAFGVLIFEMLAG